MPNNPSTLLQWDRSSGWYDTNMGNMGDNLNNNVIHPALIEKLGNLNGKTILDVGCGSGYFTFEIAQRAEKVVGVDFAPSFVKLCQKKYKTQKNLSFLVQDIADKFEFGNESFDIILCKMVLQYVESITLFAKESSRMLKNNGRLIVVVDHPFHSQFFYAQSLTGKQNPKYKHLENYFSKNPQEKLSLWGKVKLTWYPKTVEEYITAFLKVGLRLADIREIKEAIEGVDIPRILLLEFIK